MAGTEAPAGPGHAQERRCRFRQGAWTNEFKKADELHSAIKVDGSQFRSRPWRCGDCRHHLLHQHLQSFRHDRRRPACAQCGEEGPYRQAVGQDVARARKPGGHRISQVVGPAERSRQARLRSRGLWLHHLHRQFRPAAGSDFGGDPARTISSPQRCFPAIAISRAASIRMCAPTIWPRRRSSSPMRWRVRSMSISARIRWAMTRTASPSISGTSGPPPRRSPPSCARTSRARLSPSYKDVFKGDAEWRKIKVEGGLTYQMEPIFHLCAEPALFRRA